MNRQEWRYKYRLFLEQVATWQEHLYIGSTPDKQTAEWWDKAREMVRAMFELRKELEELPDEET
jgi:hypothetical protein